MHLVRGLESDERMVAIAGQKARVMQQFGLMPSIQQFELTDLTLTVNVGVGSMDPMQKLGKLKAAIDMLLPMMEAMTAQGITFNFEALIEEIMGAAGFKDGRRFFEFGDAQEEQGEDPAMMAVIEELKLEHRKIDVGMQEMMAELRSNEQRSAAGAGFYR